MSLFELADPHNSTEDVHHNHCNCHCHRRESMPEKWIIELYKGDATVFRENKNNRISLSKIHWLFLVPYALLKNFTRIGNLLFLFISLIMLIDPDISPYFRWTTFFPLMIYTSIYMIKVIYLEFQQRRASHRVNSRKTRKGKKEGGGIDEEVEWKDLKPGDIVYLKKGEICPADIVLLDTNLPKNKGMICWVDTQAVDGFMSYTMKKAVSATRIEKGSSRKDNYKEYRKILSGKIEYDPPTNNYEKFSGYIKLKKDPRPEHLTIENLVLRGSMIKNTDWIYGICIYTGHDTKVMMNSSYKREKKSYFERIGEKFFLFGLFLVGAMSVISIVVFLADKSQNMFSTLYSDNHDNAKLLYYIILYNPTLPLAFYCTFDLILLMKRAALQSHTFKKGTEVTTSVKNPAVTVMNPNSLPNLGQVDYCFIDKTGTLTTGEYKIKSLYINSKLYKINADHLQSRLTDFREKKAKSLMNQGISGVKDLNISQKDHSQITMLSQTPNLFSHMRDTDNLLIKSYQSEIDLDIADDPEFQPNSGLSNTYKFKEEIDTKTKQNQTQDFSHFEISHLGMNKSRNLENLLSPQSTIIPKEGLIGYGLSHFSPQTLANDRDEDSAKIVTRNPTIQLNKKIITNADDSKNLEAIESGYTIGHTAGISKEEDEEKPIGQKLMETISQDPNGRGRRVSFSLPDGTLKSATSGEPKEPQEKYFLDNDYIIDCFTLNDANIDEFHQSLAICHSARSRYVNDEYLYECSSADELAMMKFGRLFGKGFLVSNRPDNPSEYTVKENGNIIKYNILGVNDFSYLRKRFSVVYRTQEEGSPAIVYAKGLAYNMKQAFALDNNETEAYDRIITHYQELGYKAIAIGRKEMKDDEASEYYKKYQNCKMSLYNQAEDLEVLSREVESGLKLVGIVGLQDEPCSEACETIEMLKKADVKVWMVTGDNQENAISTSYITGILNRQTDLQSINIEKADDAKASIRNLLNNIKKNYKGDSLIIRKSISEESKPLVYSKTMLESSNNKLAIQIDGNSLELIFRDPYLKSNFAFICALCQTVIGYRFSPIHKKMILNMVKESFHGRPITMAVGDGLNDALMLGSADISIELRANKELLPSNAGDIQLASLSLLKEIMLIDGRNISEKVEKSFHYMFYKSIVIGAPIFFFNYFNGFTGTPLFDPILIFLYGFWFTFFPVLVFGGFDASEPRDILLKFPALYIDGKNKKQQIWKNFLVQALLESILHGVIGYFTIAYALNSTFNHKGHVSDFEMSALAQYFSIIIVVNMKLYWLFKTKKLLSFFMTALSVISLIIYLFVNNEAKFIRFCYLQESQAIFERFGSLVAVFLVIAVPATISYLVRHYLVEKVYQSLYDWCAEMNAGDHIEGVTNEAIASHASSLKDLGAIVKSIYKQTELMDPIVQEMLSPADQNVNQLGIRKYRLNFYDTRMERQYRIMTSRKALKLSKVLYPMALLIFGAYALGEALLIKDEVYNFSRMGVFVGFALFGCLIYTDIHRAHYFDVTFFYIFMFCVTKAALDWTGNETSVLAACLIPLASATLFKVSAFWLCILNVCYFILFEIRIMFIYFGSKFAEFNGSLLLSFYAVICYALVLIGINSIILFLGHNFEQNVRNEHFANAKLEIQMNKSNDILSILLPKFIKEKIDKIGAQRTLAEDQGEVTLLFCDIMDFDKIIQKEGKRVVNLLDHIFRVFDQHCATNGIQKIETVGKTYMACAGLKSCEIGIAKKIRAIDPTRRILNMALDMEEMVKKMKYGEGISMRLRIGIHYGRVIAGVIGYHKPQFSLVGDAVNTTSRVCTANNPGQIRMSDEAYTKMMEGGGPGRSEIYFFSKVEEMKGKGQVKVHIVARKTHNRSFRGKVGQALQKNKSLGLFTVSKSQNEDITKPRTDVLQKFKDVLNLKEKIEEELCRAQPRSMQGTPSSSFIKTIKDDAEDFQEYDDDETDIILLKPDKYFLTLSGTPKKAVEFEENLLTKKRLFQRGSMLGLFLIYLLDTIFMLIIQHNFKYSIAIIILRICFLLFIAVIAIFYQILTRWRIRKSVVVVVFTIGFVISSLQAYWSTFSTFHRIQLMEMILLYIVGTHSSVLDFVTSIILSAALACTFLVSYGIRGILDIQSVFFVFTFILVNLIHVFIYFRTNIKFYNSLQTREKRKIEQSGLVSQLLPVHAAEKYFSDPTGGVDVSDEFEDVTLLYADIKGFTDFSAGVEAKDVVHMLSTLFTSFDKVCYQYSLYKVYTIGDCYVVLSFVNAANRDPGKEANSMVKMAMAMIEIIREVRAQVKFEELDMRIGIHTGNVIGGIVGTDIVRYDIWGQDVLIANAMESEGQKGHINVSEATKNLLERTHRGLYRFEPYKTVEMEKIESKIPCYLLYSNQNYEEY